MKLKRAINYIVICYVSVFLSAHIAKGDVLLPEITRLVGIVETTTGAFGYRSMRGYQVPDEWEVADKKALISGHAYFTLFGKNSDNSCLNMTGRISITILNFKTQELARRHIEQTKTFHLGNLGGAINQADVNGYLIWEVNGWYAAIKIGETVVLIEDGTMEQKKIVEAMLSQLKKEII